MRNLIILTIALLFLPVVNSTAQDNSAPEKSTFNLSNNQGKFFFYWGYNRAYYAKSDIYLKGDGYDFTLSDVQANDLPSELSSSYLDPSEITIPQFNLRIGYFINDKYAIAIGWDHMKYRTKNGSNAIIDGHIDSSASSRYAGSYNNTSIVMDANNLIKIEHSDGYNVINANLERHDLIVNSADEKLAFNLVSGAGIGVAMPWTNAFIFGKRNDDRPHFSGLGLQLFVAPEFIVYRHLFLRYTAQGGFTKMWDIVTSPRENTSAYAKQNIFYFENSLAIGYRFRISNKN